MSGQGPTGVVAALAAVLARPRLWGVALRQVRVLVPPRWWARAPFLPLPSRAWLRFRMTTAYGDPGAAVRVDDLLVWLAWTATVRPPAPPSTPARRRRGRR